MSKTLEGMTLFGLGALVCSLGSLIGTSENLTDANAQKPEHVPFQSVTLAYDEMTYILTPRSIKITDAKGYIEIGHGAYFPAPVKANWGDYVLSGTIYERMGAGDVDNAEIDVKCEIGDVKTTRHKN